MPGMKEPATSSEGWEQRSANAGWGHAPTEPQPQPAEGARGWFGEPWRVNPQDPYAVQVEEFSDMHDTYYPVAFMGKAEGDSLDEVVKKDYANARRIVACVNALAGFADPERDVAALRAALEKALTRWRARMGGSGVGDEEMRDYERASALLARLGAKNPTSPLT